MFGFLWFKFIFWPWWKVKKSVQLTYKGIKICYHEPFDAQERVQLKMGIDNIEQKFENKLSVSKVCIIEDAFSNLVAMLVDDINEKYFNARYGTTYSRIEGLASGKLIIVNISNGIETSALRHEIAHVVLSNCSASKSEEAQHEIMKQVGV